MRVNLTFLFTKCYRAVSVPQVCACLCVRVRVRLTRERRGGHLGKNPRSIHCPVSAPNAAPSAELPVAEHLLWPVQDWFSLDGMKERQAIRTGYGFVSMNDKSQEVNRKQLSLALSWLLASGWERAGLPWRRPSSLLPITFSGFPNQDSERAWVHTLLVNICSRQGVVVFLPAKRKHGAATRWGMDQETERKWGPPLSV